MHSPCDLDRAFTNAETALRRMREVRHPPSPRNFALWFHVAEGRDPLLVEAVEALLSGKGYLTADDVDALIETHLSPAPPHSRFDTAGLAIREEVDDLMSMVSETRDAIRGFSTAVSKLRANPSSCDEVEKTITDVLATIGRVEASNEAVERRLIRAREEMVMLYNRLDTVRRESLTCKHTLLASRTAFDMALNAALREVRPFCLLVTDIDHFKSFNDRFGHLMGDQVLRLVASVVKRMVGRNDLAARYGGEEFAILMPDLTMDKALAAAERIRRAVMSQALIDPATDEDLGRVTVSVGVAGFQPGDTVFSLVDRADKCLYAAKHAGRNQVVGEEPVEAGGASAA